MHQLARRRSDSAPEAQQYLGRIWRKVPAECRIVSFIKECGAARERPDLAEYVQQPVTLVERGVGDVERLLR